MNSSRNVARLNELFRVFGECPLGLRYKWVWTPDMEFYVMSGNAYTLACAAEWKPTVGGILAPQYDAYRKMRWSDVYGPCWIIAKYWKPMSEKEWHDLYGAQIPWPRQGEYHAIENLKLLPGREPSDRTTKAIIWMIHQDNQKTYQDHIQEGDQLREQEMQSTMSRIESELTDTLTAFGKVPGSRGGGVSLPSTRFDAKL